MPSRKTTKQDVQTKVALIGTAGIVVAALITGIFSFQSSKVESDAKATAAEAGRLLTAMANKNTQSITTDMPAPANTPSVQETLGNTSTPDPQSVLSDALNWPLVMAEPFDNNSAGWELSGWNSDSTKIGMEISNGVYHWKMQDFHKDSWWNYWLFAPLDKYSDFYLSVKIKREPGPSFISYYGLIFKRQGYNLYDFIIDDYGQYTLRLDNGGMETYLAGPTNSSMIKKGMFNEISVVVIGEEIYLYINGVNVQTVVDDSLASGNVGVRIGTQNSTGDEIQYDIDDFVVRSKP